MTRAAKYYNRLQDATHKLDVNTATADLSDSRQFLSTYTDMLDEEGNLSNVMSVL